MNDTELRQARNQYQAKVKENNEVIERKKELEQLKQNKDVLRYIALSKYESMRVKSDGEIIYETFKEIGEKTKNSQRIYVFMGSYLQDYSFDSGTGKAITHKHLSTIKNAAWIKYNDYWDLETIETVRVARKDIAEFEKNNIVIYNDDSQISLTTREYQNFFFDVQEEYYKLLTTTTQEKALAKIRKRHKLS